MLRKFLVFVGVAVFIALGSAAYAQGSGPGYGSPVTPTPQASGPLQRTVLQTMDFPGGTYKTIQISGVLAPGGFAAWHTHPGIEVVYVLYGEGDLMVKGQPTRHVKDGDSWIMPEGTPHALQNTSSIQSFRFVSVYVVDKSKPLASPANGP